MYLLLRASQWLLQLRLRLQPLRSLGKLRWSAPTFLPRHLGQWSIIFEPTTKASFHSPPHVAQVKLWLRLHEILARAPMLIADCCHHHKCLVLRLPPTRALQADRLFHPPLLCH